MSAGLAKYSQSYRAICAIHDAPVRELASGDEGACEVGAARAVVSSKLTTPRPDEAHFADSLAQQQQQQQQQQQAACQQIVLDMMNLAVFYS
jgi:hypothetical protein